MSLWIKSCPRCGGDLYSDLDVMGFYRQCMQCGYTVYENRRRPPTGSAAAPGSGPAPPGEPDHAIKKEKEAA